MDLEFWKGINQRFLEEIELLNVTQETGENIHESIGV